jgi:hypothetical protein
MAFQLTDYISLNRGGTPATAGGATGTYYVETITSLRALLMASPTLTGTPLSTTAAANTNTTQIATTAFVVGQAATVAALVNGTAAVGTSLLYARQDHVHPSDTTRAPLVSPTFTGTPAAPTAGAGTATTQIATTAFVDASFAKLASPALTGTPTAPTPAANDNSTKIATTAYVDSSFATAVNGLDWKASVRFATTANDTLSGLAVRNGVTPVAGDRVGVIAQTTASANGIYVAAAGAWVRATDADSSAKVTSGLTFMSSEGTSGAGSTYTLTTADPISLGTTSLTFVLINAGSAVAASSVAFTPTGGIAAANVQAALAELDTEKANIASPTFTGTPTLPTGTIGVTQAAGNSTTALATTAFVTTAVAAAAGAFMSYSVAP